MGDKLTNSDEVLYRQIHPHFLSDGEPSSDRFRPSENDKNLLSVDRSSLVSAAASHATYTANGSQSAAVFGLSVQEFAAESIGCWADPLVDNPAHALADYSNHPLASQRTIAKRLKRLAIARGCLFTPPVVAAAPGAPALMTFIAGVSDGRAT